jgi:hypothetical protein
MTPCMCMTRVRARAGAGKTTLLRVLAGQALPPLPGAPGADKVRAACVCVCVYVRVYAWLRVACLCSCGGCRHVGRAEVCTRRVP